MDWLILAYDLASILLATVACGVLAVLYLKGRSRRTLAYLTSVALGIPVVGLLGYYQLCAIMDRPYPQACWNAISYLMLALSASVPLTVLPPRPERRSWPRIAFPAAAAALLALELADDLFVGDPGAYLVLYVAGALLFSAALLVFALGGKLFPQEGRAKGELLSLPAMYAFARGAMVALFPLVVGVDFFGWLIPGLALPPGLSAVPALLIAMSPALTIGAAIELLAPAVAREAADPSPALDPAFGLSPREAEVAALLLQYLSYAEIAERLFIAPGTVRSHALHIYQKTGARGRAGLGRLARGGEQGESTPR